LQLPSIAATRQPRLPLPGEEAWLEDVWEALPVDVQRNALQQLARLLVRWFAAPERRQ
jgi:hypothetical protein